MAKTFSDAPHYSGAIGSDFRLGIQTGQTPSASGGLAEMMNIKASELRAYMREGMASVYNYRGEYNTLPTDLAVGDAFYASSTFTSGGHTYTQGHLYAWNGTSWDDITNIFSQYAQQGQVDNIDSRLTDAEVKIDAMGDGIVVKGECTYAELIAIVDPEVGWEYWVTDMNSFYLYSEDNGWITVDAGIVQTPDATDNSHALSNAKTTQMITDVKNALQATNARVENLEQKAGGYTVVNYRGTNAVPTGKAKYAMVEKIVGKSRAWNQLCVDGNMEDSSKWAGRDGDPVSVSNNVLTVTTTSGSFKGLSSNYYIRTIKDHKYLLAGSIKSSVSGVADINFSNYSGTTNLVPNQWALCTRIINSTSSEDVLLYFMCSGSFQGGDTLLYKNLVIRDLTLIFGSGNEPSTVAEAVALCPSILTYDAYGYSLVDTTVEGVVSNWFDGQTQSGYWRSLNGTRATSSTELCSVNRIEVEGGKSYTIDNIGSDGGFRWYDSSDNYLTGTSVDNVSTAVAPSNAKYLRFNLGTAYGTTYKNDIVVHPTGDSNALSLPSPVTLRSAGSGYEDVLDVETGVPTRKAKEVDFSTLTFGESGGIYYTQIADLKELSNSGVASNYLVVNKNAPDLAEGEMNVGYNANYIQIKTSSTPIGKLVYPLATPITGTSIGATPNNTIKTEGGGTINTIQTQTTQIDNCLDVGYLAV